MPKLFGIIAIVALLELVAIQGQAADDQKADLDPRKAADATTVNTDALEGKWELTGFEFGGQKIAVPKGKEMSLTFKGGKVTKKDSNTKDMEGTYKVDTTKNPKKLDLTAPKEGDPKTMETSKAIYSLEGDILKIAFGGNPDAPRPTGFDAKDIGILNFKKAKK